MNPGVSFSTVTVEVVFGSIFSPGMTIWFFFPVYWSGSNVNSVFWLPTDDRCSLFDPQLLCGLEISGRASI